MWRWGITKFEHIQAVVAMLWPWLSDYRKEQYKTFVNHVKKVRRDYKLGPRKLRILCRNSHDNWTQWKQSRICKTCHNIRQNSYCLNSPKYQQSPLFS